MNAQEDKFEKWYEPELKLYVEQGQISANEGAQLALQLAGVSPPQSLSMGLQTNTKGVEFSTESK